MSEIAEAMSDNEALRRLVGGLDSLVSLFAADYSVTGDNAIEVTVDEPHVEEADEDIIKRVITNLGDNPAVIKESGVIVSTLLKNETWISDLSGIKEITVTSVGGCTIAAANYKKVE